MQAIVWLGMMHDAMRDSFDDDDQLVAALRRGDPAAFEWLLDTYSAPLRRLALTFVRTPALADEVVQETWLGVVKGIDGFEQRSSVKTWIFRILTNRARTKGSREHRMVPFSATETDDGDPSGVFPPEVYRSAGEEWGGWWAAPPGRWEPAEGFDRAETLRRVRDAIQLLPSSQRTVMSLRDIDGWSSDEVCAVLGITHVNQRVLLHRARAKVRAELNPYFESVDA